MPPSEAHKEMNGHRKPSATIYDIARELKLSPSTVSRALNKPGRISPKTEERIREVAKRLDYRTNRMARALPTGRTRMLGLVVSDLTNPVFFGLIRGAKQACSELGYTLVLVGSQESGDVELEALDRLLPAVDGVVLAAARLNDDQIARIAEVKDVVLVNRGSELLPSVVPDIHAGVSRAIAHLKELGHATIAYVSGPTSSWMSNARGEALFVQTVDAKMSFVEIGPNAPNLEGGESALLGVRASGATAVLTYNDLMAIGLLRACRVAGLSVPGALSIVGFDDIFGADATTPAITTIRSPLHSAGFAAVRLLVTALEGDGAPHDDPLVTELVLRESTGSPI